MKEQKIIMEKQMENKKKVLIDLTNYGSIAVGFGQIAVNYAALFASLPTDDIHFIYLMRKRSMQDFGENVTCIPVRRINKLFPFTLPKVDVWHAVNQQRKLARVAKGTKFIFTIHDFNFLKEKKPWKVKLYLRRMQHKIDKAAVVTAISHYTADIVRQHVNMRGKEIRVIYNGVERIDTLEGARPAFATGRPFFFTIGQIRKKKNFHLLLDVMQSFPEYDLYICGDTTCGHGVYSEELRTLIREKQLSNVYLAGVVTQPEKVWLYRNCDAFLFPSEGEGFGLPVIEAMQFGKAVFAASRTSLPEVCGGHAFMWDQLDTDSMVRSIQEHLPDFYKNEERINNMKEYAYSFSYEKHIQAYLDLYRELARQS